MSGPSRIAPRLAWPPRVLVALGWLCAAGLPLFNLLGQDRSVTLATQAALAVLAVLTLYLAWTYTTTPRTLRRVSQIVALGLLGLTAGVPAYFFGPFTGYAAPIALSLLFAGVSTGDLAVRWPRISAGVIYTCLALGQAAPVVLVLSGSLPDRSLSPIFIPGQAVWQIVAGHVALQIVYFGMFLLGGAVQHRFRDLARDRGVPPRLGIPAWFWAILGAGLGGPAYALGLHSAFTAVVVACLFAGGRRSLLLGVTFAHTGLFVLVMLGVLGDNGQTAVRWPGALGFQPWLVHGLIAVMFLAAHLGGRAVRRRFQSTRAELREQASWVVFLSTWRFKGIRARLSPLRSPLDRRG